MKRILLASLLFVVAVLIVPPAARAQTTVFGSLTTISNTTENSATIQTNTVSIRVGTFIISNGGLTDTNAFSGIKQWSIDGTNFYPIGATYRPLATNAASETVQSATISFPIYLRLSATTTNSVQVGATYLPPY